MPLEARIALVHLSEKQKSSVPADVQKSTVFECLPATENAQFVDRNAELHLEHFVCALYGRPAYQNTNIVHADIFQSRYSVNSLSSATGIDIGLLPPCHRALSKHILRANHVALTWKNAHVAFPFLPSPVGSGWNLNANNQLEIDWITGDLIRRKLVDMCASQSDSDTEHYIMEDMVEEEYDVDNIIDNIFSENEDD